MSDQITELYNEALRPAITALTFEVLFYGFYIALSATYFSLLARQKNQEKFKHLFYPVSTLVLFILSTAGIILSTFDIANLIKLLLVSMEDMDPTAREETFVRTRTAIGVVYALANWIGDIILIYRCYFVWNGRWLAVVAPSFLSALNTAMVFASIANIQLGSSDEFATGGYSSQVTTGDNLQYAFLAMNVFNNILLTGLIAGRLWYLNRASTKLFGINPTPDKRYRTIVSMFLESGSLYPIALVICLIIQLKGSSATMDVVLLQIVGIAPMLILVRTTLGISIESAPRREDVDTELEHSTLRINTYTSDQKFTPPFALTPGTNFSPMTGTDSMISDYQPRPEFHALPYEPSSSNRRSMSSNYHAQSENVFSGSENLDHGSTGPSTPSDRLQPLRWVAQ
ncbi:MAG: hypothetical protein NXY57DRAFT_1019865 [Lentinula lateritia]|uniref:Uncharacterized protein n=1 Tax=Lentinula lateritia TaxID=40482 RepID=A0ABQ8VFI5_9AGAR|nr:MAG: hypothetical protein NXY57DRAFT_1019865 [Lentinula lateritia]KAJ4492404.1 hypothetical protein C8R41DRAFT_919949 [Lentinula lateritia]